MTSGTGHRRTSWGIAGAASRLIIALGRSERIVGPSSNDSKPLTTLTESLTNPTTRRDIRIGGV
jgi:ABC-type hemin transport system substrate-binding protein